MHEEVGAGTHMNGTKLQRSLTRTGLFFFFFFGFLFLFFCSNTSMLSNKVALLCYVWGCCTEIKCIIFLLLIRKLKAYFYDSDTVAQQQVWASCWYWPQRLPWKCFCSWILTFSLLITSSASAQPGMPALFAYHCQLAAQRLSPIILFFFFLFLEREQMLQQRQDLLVWQSLTVFNPVNGAL